MRARHVLVLASLGALAAIAACTLNPQPLPPRDDDRAEATNADSGFGNGKRADSGNPGTDPESPEDAASPPNDVEGGAADAGDAGDASSDAPTDG